MLRRIYQTKFVKDVALIKKHGKCIEKLREIIDLLLEEKPLPVKYKSHKLHGKYNGYRECHIESDWLLIYMKTKTEVIFARTGTHSDVF